MGVLVVYTLYGVFALPVVNFLLSIGVGLVVFSAIDSFEIAVLVALFTGVVATLISTNANASAKKTKEGFSTDSGEVITARVNAIRRPQEKQPLGVYASGFVEGFEDVEVHVEEEIKATGSESKAEAKGKDKPSAAATSKPAPVDIANFKGSKAEPDGLFKLGVIPTESKGGFHIDQGTTVMNALNALNPEQVKQMSSDTQKLIDTQKSLMMMLGTMKPMLSDGRQLMDSFNQMFGASASVPGGQMATLPDLQPGMATVAK